MLFLDVKKGQKERKTKEDKGWEKGSSRVDFSPLEREEPHPSSPLPLNCLDLRFDTQSPMRESPFFESGWQRRRKGEAHREEGKTSWETRTFKRCLLFFPSHWIGLPFPSILQLGRRARLTPSLVPSSLGESLSLHSLDWLSFHFLRSLSILCTFLVFSVKRFRILRFTGKNVAVLSSSSTPLSGFPGKRGKEEEEREKKNRRKKVKTTTDHYDYTTTAGQLSKDSPACV